MPEPAAPRKEPARALLFAPYVVLAMLLGGWCVGWWVVKGRMEEALDRGADGLRRAGWRVVMADRRVDGFPFRLRVGYGPVRLAAPSGWAVETPSLQAQAYLHAPDHWVLVAPRGLTFIRPAGGAVAVSGLALRASLVGLGRTPWRAVLEGVKLSFQPAPGARPFALSRAELVQLYVRPGPTAGEAEGLLRVEGGVAGPGSLLSLLAADEPVNARVESRVTRLADFAGTTWREAGRSWSAAGGQWLIDRADLDAGGFHARLAASASLGASGDGRLEGRLPLTLTQAPAALGALTAAGVDPLAAARIGRIGAARATAGAASVDLVFQAGATTIGPARIGPAPRLF